jgi:AraC family transcriptional regulator of adaptative response/methylated-DNA-[protein]-cysteine methyltransferase
MKIDYVTTDCPLGRLLVGFTERGISAVYLGDKDGPLEAELRREYPRAKIQQHDGEGVQWVKQIVACMQGQDRHLNLPLDLAATAFQMRVWEELRRIPHGSTRSYSEVARRIGKPSATRAVARACATNPVSVVVPCHRVIRKDGDLVGYRWGLSRKEKLIANERKLAKN